MIPEKAFVTWQKLRTAGFFVGLVIQAGQAVDEDDVACRIILAAGAWGAWVYAAPSVKCSDATGPTIVAWLEILGGVVVMDMENADPSPVDIAAVGSYPGSLASHGIFENIGYGAAFISCQEHSSSW